jgi:hypothetical protein
MRNLLGLGTPGTPPGWNNELVGTLRFAVTCNRPRNISNGQHVLPELTITLNDSIDHFAALHTALCGKLQFTGAIQQIHAEVTHHESAASAAR